jgi:dTMP kinase
MAGFFIVFEGPDGSGTTLHSRLLSERLTAEGMNVLLTFEPTDGPIGLAIREELTSGKGLPPQAIQERFSADRAWHVEHVIEPALEAGKVVISDRYALSTLAYGEAQGVDPAFLAKLNKNFVQPDCSLLLLPPFDVCQERLRRREVLDSFEKEEFQRKVHAIYERFGQGDPHLQVVDTSGEKEEVAEEIYRKVKSSL